MKRMTDPTMHALGSGQASNYSSPSTSVASSAPRSGNLAQLDSRAEAAMSAEDVLLYVASIPVAPPPVVTADSVKTYRDLIGSSAR